jgi:hypothetical protein
VPAHVIFPIMADLQNNYEIVRRLEDGQIISVATQSDLPAAKKLIQLFNAEWPGDYSIRDSSNHPLGERIQKVR